MPTVIDSFVVEFGLDTKNLTKGQREVVDGLKKMTDQSQKSAGVIETSHKKAAEAVGKLQKELLGLFAILMGAKGLKDFVSNITTTNAALGYFSKNLNLAPQAVSAWEMAAQRMGGTAEATGGTLERVGKALYDLRVNGKPMADEFYRLQAAAGMNIDTDHGVNKYLTDTAEALQRVAKTDPTKAHFFAQGMGIDDATANVMIKYGAAVGAYVGYIQKTLAPTDQAVKSSQELKSAWTELGQTAQAVGDDIATTLTPVLIPLLTGISDWLKDHRTDIQDALKRMGADLEIIGSEVNNVVDDLGGWKKVTGEILDLWLGYKFTRMLGNMRLASAAAGGGGPAALSGRRAFGSKLRMTGAVAGTLGMFENMPDLNTPEGNAQAQSNADAISGFGKFLQKNLGIDWLKDRFGLGGGDGVTVDGQKVSKANPLPVTAVGSGTDSTGRGVGGSTGSGVGGGTTPSGGGGVTPTGANAGVRGWWTAERQKHAYEVLTRDAHLSPSGAKGLIARWAAVESGGGPTSANNIGGGHYGIAQWDHARAGSVWGNPDFDAQLGNVVRELNGPERAAGDALRRARNDSEGAIGASRYERAEGYNAQTGIDSYTGRTLGAMNGMDKILQGGNLWSGFGGTPKAIIQHNPAVTTPSSTTNNHTSSNEIHIAALHVHTKATDSNGIARSIQSELRRTMAAGTANFGLA